MSHSNTTPNWKIPQFTSNDVPSWLGDVNQIGQKVEQGLNAVKIIGQDANTAASGAQATANALTPRVAANEQGIEGLLTVTGSQGTAISGLDTRVTALENDNGDWIEIQLTPATNIGASTFKMFLNKASGLVKFDVGINDPTISLPTNPYFTFTVDQEHIDSSKVTDCKYQGASGTCKRGATQCMFFLGGIGLNTTGGYFNLVRVVGSNLIAVDSGETTEIKCNFTAVTTINKEAIKL